MDGSLRVERLEAAFPRTSFKSFGSDLPGGHRGDFFGGLCLLSLDEVEDVCMHGRGRDPKQFHFVFVVRFRNQGRTE